jgi:2-phosphosulfolactate phosphatase
LAGKKTVLIDAFPQSAFRQLERDAVVCVDVISSGTILATAVAQGRRAFVARSEEQALSLAAGLEQPLLCADLGGPSLKGFDPASPEALSRRTDVERPLVLFGNPGTVLMTNADGCPAVYVACFRNMTATVAQLARRCDRVAVLGAGCRAEFSCEDQMAAAWITEMLIKKGFEPEDVRTSDLVKRWSQVKPALAAWGNSADLLRQSGQQADLAFVLDHIDDLAFACRSSESEVGREEVSSLPALVLPVGQEPASESPEIFVGATNRPVH